MKRDLIGETKISPRSKYWPHYAELARNYCLLGATVEQLADFFEVSPSTIDGWRKTHPAFAEALYEGRAVADAKVAAALYRKALGFTYTSRRFDKKGEPLEIEVEQPPDIDAIKFWLTNRQAHLWSMKMEYTGANGAPLVPGQITDLEVARRIAFILASAVHGETIEQEAKK